MGQIISGLRKLPRAAALATILAGSLGLVAGTPTKVMANSMPQLCPEMRNYQIFYYDQLQVYWYTWSTHGHYWYEQGVYEGQMWDNGQYADANISYEIICGWLYGYPAP
ncbi:MAG TPA: hypothetical protein VF337_09965 [Candidatus Limnocylindrales bacterium]